MGYLSDAARRRIAAVILIVGIVLAVLAITDSAFFEDPPTESEKVAAAVRGFFDAAKEEKFEDACDRLTKGAQDTMRQAAARALETDQRLRCSQIMESVVGDSFADVMFRVRPGVSISGNRARAEASLKTEGELAQFRTILLEQDDDGSWLISDFG